MQDQPLVTEDIASLNQNVTQFLWGYLQSLDMEIKTIQALAHNEAIDKFSGGNLGPNLEEGLMLTTDRATSEGTDFGGDALIEEFANTNNNFNPTISNSMSELNEGYNVNAIIIEISFIPISTFCIQLINVDE